MTKFEKWVTLSFDKRGLLAPQIISNYMGPLLLKVNHKAVYM